MPQNQYFSANGLRLHYLDWGGPEGRPVVLLHGGAASVHWWDWVAPLLAGSYRVYALDFRGHGNSENSEPPYSTTNFVADLEGLIAHLGLDQPGVVGHSMGGHVALAHAILYPDSVGSLVVLDSLVAMPDEILDRLRSRSMRPARRYETLEDAVSHFRVVPPQELPEALLRDLAAKMFRQEPDGRWIAKADRKSSDRELFDVPPRLGEIRCPTLVVRAGKNEMSGDSAEIMAAKIPLAEKVELPGVDHHFILDHSELAHETIHSFLSRCEKL